MSAQLMSQLKWIWESQNRRPVLLLSAAAALIIALVDWWTKPFLSLGFLVLVLWPPPIRRSIRLAGFWQIA